MADILQMTFSNACLLIKSFFVSNKILSILVQVMAKKETRHYLN